MTVRTAEPSDVAAIAALEAPLFGVDAWSSDVVRASLSGLVVIGEPVHAYAALRVTGEVADLDRIGVHPDVRRQGVASVLLDAVLDRARTAGAERVLLEVSVDNDGAIAFYVARGFAEIDRRPRYYRDGSDALVLERAL